MTDEKLRKSIVDIQKKLLEFQKTHDSSILKGLESDCIGYLHLFTFIANPDLFVEFSHVDTGAFDRYIDAIMDFVHNYHIQDDHNKSNLS